MMKQAAPLAAALLLSAAAFSSGARADAPAVAILVQSAGEVTVAAPKEKPQAAPALVKLHAGETLHLGKNARARIVYFASGRQESWQGAGQVLVDEQAGKGKGLQPTVEQVPPLVAGQLKQTPSASQRGRAAMIVTRAAPQLAKVQKLQDEYKALKQDNPGDALLPEVFYLNGLLDLREYGLAKAVLDDLRSKPEYQSVVDLYGPILGQ